jgi:hypothetical protein
MAGDNLIRMRSAATGVRSPSERAQVNGPLAAGRCRAACLELFDQEPCRVGDIVAAAMVIEVVVAVEVAAPGLLVAEPQVERCCARVVIGDAEPDLVVAAFTGTGFVGADDGCSDALGPQFWGPDFQAVQLGALG